MRLQKLLVLALALLSLPQQSVPAEAAPWTFGPAAGTLAGDAAWAKGAKHGISALQLSGHGSLDVPEPVVDTRRSFTVSAWVKLKQVGGYQTFVSMDGSQISGFFLQLRASGTFGFTRFDTDQTNGPASLASSVVPVQPGVWYNLVGVQDAAAQTISLYVNGVLQQTVPYKTPWQATGPTEIGRGKYNGQPVDYVHGEIDDVHLTQGVALDTPQLAAIAAQTHALDSALAIDFSKPGPRISPQLYGLMIEDISHSIDGGLYAELIQNRALKDNPNSPVHWAFVGERGAGTLTLDTTQPVPNTVLTNSLRLDVKTTGTDAGAANDGYWGIPVRPNTVYRASFYAKASAGYMGSLTALLQEAIDGTVSASATVPALSPSWKKYTLTLTTGQAGPSADNRFVLTGHGIGTIWLTQISLMPPTYHNRPNGSRIDLMQKLAALHPAFLRMPGGNYLEGNTIAERFDWKRTIGDISQRPGHPDPWGYRSDDGYGLLEYLDWCEDLHMQTVLAVFAGYALGGEHVAAGPGLAPYVQDALDEIEYATGGPNTKWGLVRVQDGHPAPFPVPYVEVGNEDFFDKSGSYDGRFAQFYDAIYAKYPHIQIIATTAVTSRKPDVLDDHSYQAAGVFEADSHHYDAYPRSGPKIFVGEYASQEGKPTPNLSGALGDAAYMTGMERNADVVILASYAPLLVNVNPGASQWPTNLIGFDALSSYVSPAYYTQQLFSLYHGDMVVPATLTGGSGLAYVVSKASHTGTVYIKIVNALGSPQTAAFTLSGAKTIAPTGTAIVLSSANLGDTNTITSPNKVRPIQSKLTGIGKQFRHVFPPYSLTVLVLKAQ